MPMYENLLLLGSERRVEFARDIHQAVSSSDGFGCGPRFSPVAISSSAGSSFCSFVVINQILALSSSITVVQAQRNFFARP